MVGSIKSVAITGGTHGNELTGVYLLKHWLSCVEEITRKSFSTELHLANPEANIQVRRFIDQDLNRQFDVNDLKNPELNSIEQRRAKELNRILGPKDNPRVDFILDLHTTTANMGLTLVLNYDEPIVKKMAFYIKQKMPHATLFFEPCNRLEDNFLLSVGRYGGLLIEVGPVAQGLLNYDIYCETKAAVIHALDYLELANSGQPMSLPSEMEAYQFIEKIPLPTNDAGEITAMVHPNLQNADYQAINPGDPLFITLAGETIPYEGDVTVYGAFINEAAYYAQKVGLSVMKKVTVSCENMPCK